ncbi:hypothetical protein Y032_0003g1331 [Ancylostoma ceylanicum]|nr:hypothetical protein Y032_0003g1331 [Ancylostoma ceylanicum]
MGLLASLLAIVYLDRIERMSLTSELIFYRRRRTFMSTAVAATNRSRVLAIYKEILRLGKNWVAKDADRTLIERKDIVNEAKQTFRDNKEVKDPKQIAELILEAEKRIVQAEHYGIPILQTSTPPTSNTVSSHEGRETERSSGVRSTHFNPIAVVFARRYFAGSSISEDILSDIVKLCSTNAQFYTDFVSTVLCSNILEQYPVRKSYRRNLLKQLIDLLDRCGIEILDELYTACASCMLDSAEYSFRIFLTQNLDKVLVVLRESNQQLCYGTTGLSLWQASCDLANFLCCFTNMLNKSVLELGAGCGLTGIAIARNFSGCSVTLSDYDPKVLSQLDFNVGENMDKACSQIKVLNLDWTTFSMDQLDKIPDVVIAADVVYDCSILPALCGVLRMCLSAKQGCCAYVASTLRDPLTLKAFRDKLDENGLRVNDEMRYQYGAFTFNDGSKIKSTSLFPHSSTLDAPTIIFEVVTKIGPD